MPRDSEDRHHRSSKSRRRSSTEKDKAESNSRTHQQRAQHKSSPGKSGAGRSNRHRCDDDRIVVDDEHRRGERRHRHHRRRRRRRSEEGDTRRRDSTTRRGEERDQERRRRKKRQSSHGNTHNFHSSHSSDESDYSSSSASSVSSLSDHFDRQQDKRQREDIPKGDDEGSLDSAYIYVVDGDEREGAKKDDKDTYRRHRRNHHRCHRSRRKSHEHRKDSDHRRRSSATTTLDSTRSSDDEGGAGTAVPATSITVKGKDIAQEIIDRRHLELELIDVREQLARALADKMRLERKAAKLDKTTKFLYQENQDLKNMLAGPSMSNGIGNDMVPSSMIHKCDIQHEMHMHVPVERKPSSSSTKQPRRQSSLAGHPYADGHGSSLSSAAFDMLHASQEAKLQVQKVQRRHSMTSAGTSSYIIQQGELPGAEQQGSSTSIFSEIPLSVLKTPPPDYYKLSPPSGGTRNRARLLSRSQSGRVSYDKKACSTHPPVANVVSVERQRRSSAEGINPIKSSSSKKIMKMDKSSSERGLCLEVDIENGREDNHSMTKKAQAMMKKAVSERLLFRSSPSSSAAGKT